VAAAYITIQGEIAEFGRVQEGFTGNFADFKHREKDLPGGNILDVLYLYPVAF